MNSDRQMAAMTFATMESISVYLPMDRRYALAQNKALPDRTYGAVLFADISGFTPLTAALTRELGPQRGAEELTRHLNRVFGLLITEVHRYQGSVISFSGDAITCWFDENDERRRMNDEEKPHPSPFTPQPSSPNLHHSSWRAVTCALAMQAAIHQLAPVQTPSGAQITFAVKVAVTAGPVRRFLVGQPHVQVVEVLAGATLDRAAAAEKQAQEGEIILGPEIAASLAGRADVQIRRDAAGQPFAVLNSFAPRMKPMPWPEAPSVADEVARKWLLPPVYHRLQRGEGAFLAELRPAVALFLKFGGINYDADDSAGAKLDAYICWVQSILARYGGFLLQLTMGDKGSYLYAVFGALLSHEDSPVRAVTAALELNDPPAALDFIGPVQIGVSRGRMYTGGYGSPMRQTYGVLGSEVNIAARLMSQAAPGQILVTPYVVRATAHQYQYEELGAVPLKGLNKPLQLYTVVGKRHKLEVDTLKGRTVSPMVGREQQRAVLVNRLQALQTEGQSSCVIIEGEAGMGKSRLVLDLLAQAQALGVNSLVGAGDAIENSAAYHAWRPLFRQFFGLELQGDDVRAPAAEWAAVVLSRLETLAPHLMPLAPLLNVVLPLDLPENELTAQLTGEVRANNTYELLVSLLQTRTQSQPLLMILEDVHWLDSPSWALTRLVHRDVHPLLLVLVTRPMGDTAPVEYTALLEAADSYPIYLQTMTREEIELMVCQRLGVPVLPERVARLIHEKAAGHPFFSEELAYALRDAGLVQVVDGECRVTPQAGALRAMDFPDTIQGVITSRIDRLSPQHQLTLKVASVIGQVFALTILRHIYPLETDKPALTGYLEDLGKASITSLVTTEPDFSYIFKHVITQEVAYGLLLYAQRRTLHQAVAEWLEQTFQEDSASAALLAYHWRSAGNATKAVDYLEKAAGQALRNNANQEAIRFLNEALSLSPEAGRDPLRLARWHRQLGEAHMRLGLMQDSRSYYEKSLKLVGRPVPTTPTGTALSTLRQIVRQAAHRLRPRRFLGRARGEKALYLAEAARVYQELTLIYYLANHIFSFLHAILYSLNLAEQANSPRELAEGYASMCVIAGAVPQLNLNPVYEPMALQAAQTLNTSAIWGFVLLRIGTYKTTAGLWQEAHQFTEQAIAHYERINDPRGWGDAVNVLGILLQLEGQFEACYRVFDDLYAEAKKHNNVQHEGWALGGQAGCLLRLGKVEEGLAKAEAALQVKDVGAVQQFMDSAVVALAYLRLGQAARAVEVADQAMAMMRGVTPTAFMIHPYFSLAQVYLSAWEAKQKDGSSESRRLARVVKQAYKVLHRFSIGKPAAWLCQGQASWLKGKPAQAHKLWQRSLAAAQRLEMPYEEGWAHYEIGRHLPATDPARRLHLQQACEIWERLKTAVELSLAQTALAEQDAAE